jgi:hypothetical protein
MARGVEAPLQAVAGPVPDLAAALAASACHWARPRMVQSRTAPSVELLLATIDAGGDPALGAANSIPPQCPEMPLKALTSEETPGCDVLAAHLPPQRRIRTSGVRVESFQIQQEHRKSGQSRIDPHQTSRSDDASPPPPQTKSAGDALRRSSSMTSLSPALVRDWEAPDGPGLWRVPDDRPADISATTADAEDPFTMAESAAPASGGRPAIGQQIS